MKKSEHYQIAMRGILSRYFFTAREYGRCPQNEELDVLIETLETLLKDKREAESKEEQEVDVNDGCIESPVLHNF